jgi:hypothetical protein
MRFGNKKLLAAIVKIHLKLFFLITLHIAT